MMLRLLKKGGGHTRPFETYDTLTDYINQLDWRFEYDQYDELKFYYACREAPPPTEIEKEALKNKVDLIEITQGNARSPIKIPVTPGLDVLLLKKQWCNNWRQAHGYEIEEMNSLGEGQGNSQRLGNSEEAMQTITIVLLHNPHSPSTQAFDDFYELCGYFNHAEGGRGEGQEKDANWDVSYFFKDRLAYLHQYGNLTDIEKKAYEQGVGVINVYSGDLGSPDQFALEEGFDLRPIIEKWCYDYASFKEYFLLKVSGSYTHLSTLKKYFPSMGPTIPQIYGLGTELSLTVLSGTEPSGTEPSRTEPPSVMAKQQAYQSP